MNIGKIIFSQIMDFVPKYEFNKCVEHYKGNYNAKQFTCWEQYLIMVFSQITYRESLRDTVVCLKAMPEKLYHMGLTNPISRSTVAYANENRDWQIYRYFAHVLIKECRELYSKEKFGLELKETVYALDSTTIDLCLNLFPWAKFRKGKGAIKLHTLLDLRGNIPSFISITDGKVHDVNILDDLMVEPGSIYIMDRGYLDFKRLYEMTQARAYYVIRAKRNFKFQAILSRKVDKTVGLRCEQTIRLTGVNTKEKYPDNLRRIKYYDIETGRRFIFLTNNFLLPAITITKLYKYKWQVELFFKWIKQNLRIKSFYGVSENAVKTQVWIAISAYVLIAIIKKKLNIELSLYNIMQIFL